MRLPGWIGPSNVQRSWNVDAEDTINWFLEAPGAGTPKVPAALVPTPGLVPWIVVGRGPVRALFSENGRMFAVSGPWFFECFPSHTAVIRGSVLLDGRPATISSNQKGGTQLLVTSGGLGYIFDLVANTFTQITDPAFPPNVLRGLFFDQYFIVLEGTNGEFFFSTLSDGTSWNALDFGLESQFSDQVVAMVKSHDDLWLAGGKNTSPWYNTGGQNVVFAPRPSAMIEHGIAAPFSIAELDNTLFWVGADEHGQGQVWRANGYTPARISTHAIEHLLMPEQTPNLEGCLAYSYQQQGHTFYVLYVPGMQARYGAWHLVYDVATGEWHKWAHWNDNTLLWEQHRSRCHCFAFGTTHLVGDRASGTIYKLDVSAGSDLLFGGL